MSFIFQDQSTEPVGLHEWACVPFNVPGMQSVQLVPSTATSYLHTGRFFTIESIYEADPNNAGYQRRKFGSGLGIRRIRANLGGGYLTWETDVNSVHGNTYVGCNGTANNTNEVWNTYPNMAAVNRYRVYLGQGGSMIGFTKDSATSFRAFYSIAEELNSRFQFKPRILETPFTYVFRCNNGRCWSLRKNNTSYPYVTLSTNMSTYETFQLIPIKYPNVYAIYNPYWNCYLAEDTHTNGPTTLGFRENGYNSYDPRYFPEAQFRIHYAPPFVPEMQRSIADTFGKFVIQSVVRPNSYVLTDSFRAQMPTPGPQTSWPNPGPPYPGNYPMLVNAKPIGEIDGGDQEYAYVELVPTQWTYTNTLQAFPVPSLDRSPSN